MSIGRLHKLQKLEFSRLHDHWGEGGEDDAADARGERLEAAALQAELAQRGQLAKGVGQQVGRLPALKALNLSHNSRLRTLCDALPPTLETLELGGCRNLRALPPALSGLTSLAELSLYGCGELEAVPDMSAMRGMIRLNICGCGGLEGMPAGLKQLTGCLVQFDDGEVVVGS